MSERRTIGKILAELLDFMVTNLGVVIPIWLGYSFAIALAYRAGSDLTWTLDRAGYIALIPTAITSAAWKYYKGEEEDD